MRRVSYTLMPEVARLCYVENKGLYRRLASGAFKPLTTVNGKRLMVVHEGERIDGPELVWCITYGCWPKYPLVQLDGNPHNTSIDNIFPVRVKPLRYRATLKGGLHYHPLAEIGFKTEPECRANWARHAADHYRKDLPYVLAEQEREMKLRSETVTKEQIHAAMRKAAPRVRTVPPKPKPTSRPAPVPGRVWHWYESAWLSVPEPVHVADDHRVRCRKVLAGAVRFEFKPEYSEVWGYDEKGQVVR